MRGLLVYHGFNSFVGQEGRWAPPEAEKKMGDRRGGKVKIRGKGLKEEMLSVSVCVCGGQDVLTPNLVGKASLAVECRVSPW